MYVTGSQSEAHFGASALTEGEMKDAEVSTKGICTPAT
jgi:hypothetical protein